MPRAKLPGTAGGKDHLFTYSPGKQDTASKAFNPCTCALPVLCPLLSPSFQGGVGFFWDFFLVGLISRWEFLDDVITLEGGRALGSLWLPSAGPWEPCTASRGAGGGGMVSLAARTLLPAGQCQTSKELIFSCQRFVLAFSSSFQPVPSFHRWYVNWEEKAKDEQRAEAIFPKSDHSSGWQHP